MNSQGQGWSQRVKGQNGGDVMEAHENVDQMRW